MGVSGHSSMGGGVSRPAGPAQEGCGRPAPGKATREGAAAASGLPGTRRALTPGARGRRAALPGD